MQSVLSNLNSSAPAESVPTPASAKALGSRLDPLDYTKGLLVICMVVYHALNYSSQFELGFRYLSFLPPSFILITGFLLQRAYFNRPANQDSAIRRRLFARGIKLLTIFTLLNIVAGFVSRRNYNGRPLGVETLLDNTFDVYVTGAGRWAIFEVLTPIAYMLLLGPLLLALHRWHRQIVPALGLLAICGVFILERSGAPIDNATLMAAGFFGILLGRVPDSSLARLRNFWVVSLLAYFGYLIASRTIGQPFFLQIFGAICALALFYGIGAHLSSARWSAWILRLGQYSLIAYIGQIAILQILSRFIHRPAPASFPWLAVTLSTLVAIIFAAELINFLRKRSTAADSVYRFVLP